ncbi:16S rRNA (adenine(1518)-N(6)/adenine(1519)-N(6))-dimethyltransferase RsmA [Microbacterium sp. MEC084]|uniref:16S rRNA (adenine(1518)-N(6)/adenine(1519)-N(6))- dimethyltransferase RsmA n=1 Tax=unclassified Microbacterium TaxID=2609290 RepID=UPI0007017E23|nr:MULTISPECIES: 16S rRNA (adenine(1518)-N(6)/adenine(1519)-N(6))-dimethyltransferase RsmA [unclassified Microbacterium]KQZ05068.1 16S rRNA methyltransferase [Microbacterium sp. Root53]MCD1267716.1 16S rRNA (adenine(1518)-N(6)/adenine(1519)-N(6))-dimethyltransferase RsmA [Microbacterium sp. MEC084]
MMVTLLGPTEIRSLAARLDVTPTKKLGQNFVVDANTVRKIVQVARVTADDRVVEVGPGLGSLTLAILETGARVTAVEIDHRLAAELAATAAAHGVPEGALTVVDADALRVTELPGDPTVLVANLPYNVSVPVLLHFMETFPALERGVVMVQAEVGERLAAPPGSKVYGAPSVKAAWYGPWRLTGTVSRQVFWPVPNVDSVLVGFHRDAEPRGTEAERELTFRIVDAAFQQRRKMLRQALAGVLGGSAAGATEVLERAGVAPTARGEELAIDDFVRIARAVRPGAAPAAVDG